MKQSNNWNEIEANEVVENVKVVPGIYHAQIKKVEDVEEKEYLKIYFDFVDGELKGEAARQEKAFGSYPNQFIIYKSYKETATKFFKAFITAIEKSNKNYVWNWNEQSLVGKYFVAVFGEEEYLTQENEVKVSCKCVEQRSIEAEKKGEIKVPELKKLKVQAQAAPTQTTNTNPFGTIATDFEIDESNLPF